MREVGDRKVWLALGLSILLLLLIVIALVAGEPTAQAQQPPSAPPLEFNQTIVKTVVLLQLAQANSTGAKFFENGTAIYSFSHPTVGNFIVTGTTPITEEAGFPFENQTVYTPDGREIKVVPD